MAARKSKAPATEVTEGGEGGAPLEGGAGEGETPPTREELIQQSAERTLEEQTGNLSVKLTQAEARANGLEGELKREKASRSKLEKQVGDLTAQLAAANTAAKSAGTAIQGLPENARQLNESVTIAVVGKGGTAQRRAQVKAGEVVMVSKDDEEVDALQQELGLQAVVYKVTKATLEDLEQSGYLHS